MVEQPERGRFGACLDAQVERWGAPAVLLCGLVLLFGGLGQSGLWDPWEMDRADLGRRLVAPAQISIGLSAKSELREPLVEVSDTLDFVPRVSQPTRTKAKSRAAAKQAIDETLDRARKMRVAAVVFDAELLIPSGAQERAWKGAYEALERAEEALPNGRVIVASRGELDGEAWTRSLAMARIKAGYTGLQGRFDAEEVSWPGGEDAFWDTHAAAGHGLERLHLISDAASEAGRAEFQHALEGASPMLVHFTDRGRTLTLPPLHHWLAAAAYSTMGVSELSARLPGALLAFLALVALVLGVHGLFGARVALFAGVVLLTSPTFFAQARSVAGEGGAILGLTLVTLALLRHAKGQGGPLFWFTLLSGLVIGFLSKGLTAPFTYLCITGVVTLVALPGSKRDWSPLLVIGLLFGLVTLWVESTPATGFAGQFRFTLPLFSDGPTDYERNFDYALKAIGFGLFPWSPLVVIGMAWMVRVAIRDESRVALVLIAAFAIPTMVSMGFLKDFNHLLWPAAPVAALALALAFERLGEVKKHASIMAFLILVMGFILARELGKGAEPLAGILVYTPFAMKGKRASPPISASRPGHALPS